MPASRVCSLCHGTGKQVVRSLSRDGTVAVEDVEQRLLERSRWMTGDIALGIRTAADIVRVEFGSARAGDSDEGGNK
jgi:hypothetical protein